MAPFSTLGHESFGIGTLFNRMSDAVLIVELTGARVVLCNSAAEALFGYGKGDIVGRSPEALVKGGWPTTPTSEQPVELEAVRRDGGPCWIEVTLSPIENREVPGHYHLAIARDITQRRQLAADLEESEARFRAFMEHGPAVASMRDESGRYVYVNAKHQELFGSQAWIGATPCDHLPASIAEQVIADDQLVLRTGKIAHFEEKMPGHGETITLMVIKFPFHGKAGQRLIGSLGVDITALKRTQAALLDRTQELERVNRELCQADIYKDQFLSVLSHELRTPISLVIGFTELLEDEASGPLNAEQKAFVAQIEHATSRLLGLVNNLIDFAQWQAGTFQIHPQSANLTGVILEMAESFRPQARAAGITLRIEVPSEPAWARIDAQQIGKVMSNLLDNALKFTPAGGTVTVRVTRHGAHLLTEVTDTGVGIAERDMPKLFDRFWQFDMSTTRARGGLGLGLAIARAIVEAHGGTIGARSHEATGSTFWFELNLAP